MPYHPGYDRNERSIKMIIRRSVSAERKRQKGEREGERRDTSIALASASPRSWNFLSVSRIRSFTSAIAAAFSTHE